MSKPKWTLEQQRAIETRADSLLVAAAAGAGKTAVLVERIIQRVLAEKDPVDIDSLLIVTFTNAAAAEMRERIGAALEKALDERPEDRRLQQQLTLLHKASITTIHSFCLSVVRNYFHWLELDPNFRIGDETETALLKLEALEELFEEKYESRENEDDFSRLLECYGSGKDDLYIQNLVLNLYNFAQSTPWPERWLGEMAENFNLSNGFDFGKGKWAEIILNEISVELAGLHLMMQKAEKVIQNTPGLEPYQERFQAETALLDSLRNMANDWERLYKAFAALEFAKLPNAKKGVDKEKQVEVKGVRDEIKKRLGKIKEEFFCVSPEEMIRDLRNLYPLMQCLVQLVVDFSNRYAEKKKEKALVDFNDLEHFCLQILTRRDEEGKIAPSQVAIELSQKFAEILVDEYQDSNGVQEELIKLISGNMNGAGKAVPVFMVGDVKQSIYRFRQAKPELFLDKYDNFSLDGTAKQQKILLYRNFRSRAEVINAVNYIFQKTMSKTLGELDYDANEALILGAEYEKAQDSLAGPVEIHLLDLGEKAAEEKDELLEDTLDIELSIGEAEEELGNIQAEARLVAKRIREMLPLDGEGTYKVYDQKNKSFRSLKYRDIVILLRATSNWAPVFAEELVRYGIPVYADAGKGYFLTIEVQTILSLLQIIDNPYQDIPLLAVLRSPIGSFTPDELVDIRLCDRDGLIYDAMQKMAETGLDGELSEVASKVKHFLARLAKWRKKGFYLSTDALLWQLYNETGYYSFVATLPGGKQRQANLRLLYERAQQFENTSYKGLFNFVNFVNKLQTNKGDMESAKIVGENEDVVRIMSIHKSKGLEFPVVILAGTGKGFNQQDLRERILMHHELGCGPDYVDYKRRIVYPTIAKQALQRRIRRENLSEEMRVLYVALTRAKEKLIIIGTVKNSQKTIAKWWRNGNSSTSKLPSYELLQGKNYLDWIGPAIIKHQDCAKLTKDNNVTDNIDLLEDGSRWEIKLWYRNDILASDTREANLEKPFTERIKEEALKKGNSEYYEAVEKRLAWQYPYRKAVSLPNKLSVTTLKNVLTSELDGDKELVNFTFVREIAAGQAEFEDKVVTQTKGRYAAKAPDFFSGERKFTPAEKGTIIHLVMQHLALNQPLDSLGIAKQLKEMVDRGLLTAEQAKVVNLKKIENFFCTPLAKRMLRAQTISREVSFNVAIRAMEIYPELDEVQYEGETIVLQGIIDCYFEEDAELVLIDYKTDYVDDNNIDTLKHNYHMQLAFYAQALEELTGKPVKERYIYLFEKDKVLEL